MTIWCWGDSGWIVLPLPAVQPIPATPQESQTKTTPQGQCCTSPLCFRLQCFEAKSTR